MTEPEPLTDGVVTLGAFEEADIPAHVAGEDDEARLWFGQPGPSTQEGMREATEANAAETALIVYRENRFCPFTSKLPERYESRIAAVAGVKSVLPIKIVVSNCRASLDVITFRGVRCMGME